LFHRYSKGTKKNRLLSLKKSGVRVLFKQTLHVSTAVVGMLMVGYFLSSCVGGGWGGVGGSWGEWCPGVPWNPWFILKAHIEEKQRNDNDENLLSRSFTKWDKLKL